MDKLNTTNGVFLDLIANETKFSQFDVFINRTNKFEANDSINLHKNEYKKLISDNQHIFEKLALLEELILQEQAIINLNEFKLSFVRQYVYVRTPFFRSNHTSKDIRVMVGDIGEWPQNANELMNNPQFISEAKTALIDAMKAEYAENVVKYTTLTTKKNKTK